MTKWGILDNEIFLALNFFQSHAAQTVSVTLGNQQSKNRVMGWNFKDRGSISNQQGKMPGLFNCIAIMIISLHSHLTPYTRISCKKQVVKCIYFFQLRNNTLPCGQSRAFKDLKSGRERSRLELWRWIKEMARHQSFMNTWPSFDQRLWGWLCILITPEDFQGICPFW